MANQGAHQVSPLAPAAFPELPPIAGVRLAAAETGIRYKNRPDVLLAVMEPGTTVAGSFTRSKSRSAPVDWCVDSLDGGSARAAVINAGNANAFTGKAGVATVKAVAKSAAKLLDCKPHEIFQASTGVIGEPLDPSFITNALPKLAETAEPAAWGMAARAIMTTDTFPKAATVRVKLGGKTVTINGIAKGSGMIAPDMATMLVFLFTDAALPAKVLQKLLSKAVDKSFNCITVDGDTSTSDTVLLFATGKAGNATKGLKADDDELKAFSKALNGLCMDLAHQVAKDGEGAEHAVRVVVDGALDDAEAERVARAVGESALVRTAVYGRDANWGRVHQAVGQALAATGGHVQFTLRFDGVLPDGAGIAEVMARPEYEMQVGLGRGAARAELFASDLGHGYVTVNAEYRT